MDQTTQATETDQLTQATETDQSTQATETDQLTNNFFLGPHEMLLLQFLWMVYPVDYLKTLSDDEKKLLFAKDGIQQKIVKQIEKETTYTILNNLDKFGPFIDAIEKAYETIPKKQLLYRQFAIDFRVLNLSPLKQAIYYSIDDQYKVQFTLANKDINMRIGNMVGDVFTEYNGETLFDLIEKADVRDVFTEYNGDALPDLINDADDRYD
jgi:hypothetical protein